MGSKMLIDAAHPEETRVVVVRNNRIDDFDYESSARKQLRGNIYLAKVTRVEPSLQAAFVDYGGNRHGFLAFSEIHPDYYQIPVADRQALLEEEAEEQSQAAAEEAAEDDASAAAADTEGDNGGDSEPVDELPEEIGGEGGGMALERSGLEEDSVSEAVAPMEEPEARRSDGDGGERGRRRRRRRGGRAEEDENGRDRVESVGSEDALEEVPERVRRRPRTYKIQEVIKRRQIILVQVVKEERGNKGAALTTYLSLAGRHTVLMPNTGRGGGISRKITNPADRKRLRKIAGELEVPEGMGLIIRTAGASRTKSEVKRDYDYLLRLWENVRDLTLKSTAPTLVYEEGNLIKRAIRDLYDKDIDEILVAGEEAYKEAKDFMRMLMPSHAKNVKPYKEPEPIFVRYGIERQLGAMFSPYVTLRSGGYIVINQTEALVSIDVNSGKATREHNIEDTALKTNLEAAEEIARQLRLRDLAGLIVIDFIDMDERRNNRAVERKLKECLRTERARVQVGRISHFGLLEMSRQRLRAGVLAGSTTPCPMCQGTGVVRSTESVALDVLRSIEDMLMSQGIYHVTATMPLDVALYTLNQKRLHLRDIETRYSVTVTVEADEKLHGGNFRIEKTAGAPAPVAAGRVVQMDWAHTAAEDAEEDEDQPKTAARDLEEAEDAGWREEEDEAVSESALGDEERPRKSRRRGRRGGRRGRGSERERSPGATASEPTESSQEADAGAEDEARTSAAGSADGTGAGPKEDGGRRRGRRRGGRRRSREGEEPRGEMAGADEMPPAASEPRANGRFEPIEEAFVEAAEPAHQPAPDAPEGAGPASAESDDHEAAPPQPQWGEAVPVTAARQPDPAEETAVPAMSEPAAGMAAPCGPELDQQTEAARGSEPEPEPAPRRRGWWQRRFESRR